MYDHILEEMADAISNELRIDNSQVLSILSRYWQDKIAHVWQVDDVLESPMRAGKPITRADAGEILKNIFRHLDSELGITWMTLEVALEDYQLEFTSLRKDEWSDVYGVFKVWCESDPAGRQFGDFLDEVEGNLTKALEFARSLSMESPDVHVFVGCQSHFEDETRPWLTVLLKDGEIEPSITENDETFTATDLAIKTKE